MTVGQMSRSLRNLLLSIRDLLVSAGPLACASSGPAANTAVDVIRNVLRLIFMDSPPEPVACSIAGLARC